MKLPIKWGFKPLILSFAIRLQVNWIFYRVINSFIKSFILNWAPREVINNFKLLFIIRIHNRNSLLIYSKLYKLINIIRLRDNKEDISYYLCLKA